MSGLQLLHAALLLVSGSGFIVFCVRTRFWLPRYAHVLAAIGLAVGLWCVLNVPSDAPLGKEGPAAKFLFALILPTIIYVFFVIHGGQKAAYRRKPKTANEIADLLERFLNGKNLYPQEWNDFVQRSHPDNLLDSYRKRCEALDPLLNHPGPQDAKAIEELRTIVQELRARAHSLLS